MLMERLLSVLKREAKTAVEGIGTNGIIYPTVVKLLKRELGNPLVVCHLKLKELSEQPEIKGNNKSSFRQYYHFLKRNNT